MDILVRACGPNTLSQTVLFVEFLVFTMFEAISSLYSILVALQYNLYLYFDLYTIVPEK